MIFSDNWALSKIYNTEDWTFKPFTFNRFQKILLYRVTIWAKSKLSHLLNSIFTGVNEILIYETLKKIIETSF